ncbi:MAG: SLC13 family permease [Rhodospirillaceae bacterium]|nr:SLC13 family permease [Rhodospirillaceae bacterium]
MLVPDLPNSHGIFVLFLTVFALYLFTRDRLPLEASALTILLLLILAFQFFPFEVKGEILSPTIFLSGFGHEALITICALMILGKGIETTGALQPLAILLAKAWMARPLLASFTTLIVSAILSAFLNNTPIVVMLLPLLVGVAIKNKLSPSSILMPIGLATIVGGMATTIGTSTNLLVVSIAAAEGVSEFQMFDFAYPALIVGSIGMLYLWLIAPKLLPERKAPLSDTTPRVFDASLHINSESTACGLTFSEVLALTDNEMKVDRIDRGKDLSVTRLPSVTIREGDCLIVKDTPKKLKLFEKQLGGTLNREVDASSSVQETQHLAEIVVTRDSMLHRASLLATRFAQRTGLLPLAIHRAHDREAGEISDEIGPTSLRSGDVVLVQGTASQLEKLKRSGNALVLDGTMELPYTHRAPRAMAIMAMVILTAALGLIPISIAAVTGIGLMLMTRCIRWSDASAALSTQIIMIIVSSLALGVAMTNTGGALFIAQLIVAATKNLPIPAILSILMLVMAILTNVVSNNATAVIGAPIAIQIAEQLETSIEPFILAVIFGANMSFATAFGYKTNLLLLSAGGYKATDFLRAGIPLILIMWAGFSLILPLIYDI